MLTLLQSIQQPNLPSLRELLANGVDVNKPCSNNQLPLEIAIKQLFEKTKSDQNQEKICVIDLLLAAGADPDKIQIKNKSLLFYLCDQGHRNPIFPHGYEEQHKQFALTIIQRLLAGKQKMDLNVRNERGETPLLIVSCSNNFELARLFLKQGADATLKDNLGYTALHYATHHSDLTYINELLEQKADVTAETTKGATVLDKAKDASIVFLLLQKGAGSKQHDLLYFFDLAQKSNHAGLIDYLFVQGLAAYQDRHNQVALSQARSYEMVERLAKKGALTHLKQDALFGLFAQWIERSHWIDDNELLRRLTLCREYKADFTVTDKQANTLLHIAYYQSTAIYQLLLDAGIAINAQNQDGQTPLHRAAEAFRVNIITSLLERNADPSLLDHKKQFALEKMTSQFSHRITTSVDCEKMLLSLLKSYPAEKLPCNIQELQLIAVDCDALIFLQMLHTRGAELTNKVYERAARNNHLKLFPWLLTILKTHPEQESLMANLLALAVQYYHPEIVELLIQKRAQVSHVSSAGDSLFSYFTQGFVLLDRATEEQKRAMNKTLSILLENKVVNQKNKQNLTPLEELLRDRGTRHEWPLMRLLLDHKATLPSATDSLITLASLAAQYQDYRELKTIVDACAQKDSQQEILAILAVEAIGKADTELMTELIKLGLVLDAPLPWEQEQNQHRRLLDEVLFPDYHLRQQVTSTPEQLASNQQKMLIFFINQGAVLHYPIKPKTEFSGISLSPLHLAAAKGWVDAMRLLLQPQHGFSIDLRTGNEERATPLQLAVENLHLEMTQELLERHANPLVIDREGKTLLHIACLKGNIPMVRLLLTTTININASFQRSFRPHSAIHIAAVYADKEAAVEMVKLLLKQGANVDKFLCQELILKNMPIDMLTSVLDKIPAGIMLETRLLHIAVISNNLPACQLLIARCPKLLGMQDTQGRSPLHHAAAPEKEAIFNLLVNAGADRTHRDYQGYDVSTYALCFHTLKNLTLDDKREAKESKSASNNSVFISEFTKLRVILIEEKEFSNSNENTLFSLSLYCYNLVSLFDTAETALGYICKYRDSHSQQPIHDLCLFQLPTHGNWQKKVWAELFLEHGIKVAPFLHWAPRIEDILGKAPDSFDQLKIAAEQINYNRERENPELAKLFLYHKIPEIAFNRVLTNYRKKEVDYLPDITVNGSVINQPKFYLKKLAADNPLGFVMGGLTNNCQKVGAQGEACAMHGMESPFGGFYAVFKRTKEKELKKAQTVHDAALSASTVDAFIHQFHEKEQRNKYQGLYLHIKTQLEKFTKIPVTDSCILDELRKQLKQTYQDLREDKIIGQCWAWISERNALVFDSWERLRAEDDILCQPFLEQAAHIAVTKHKFNSVLLGKGGQTPRDLKLSSPKHPEFPKDYYDYRDSSEQYLLKAAEDSTIPVTEYQRTDIFDCKTTEPSQLDYTPEQLDKLTTTIFFECKHVQALPSIALATCDENAEAKKLSMYTEATFSHDQVKKVCVLPLLTKENFWTACIVETGKTQKGPWCVITYLDFAANPFIPKEFYKILQKSSPNIRHSPIHRLSLAYNEDREQSGIWLEKTLQHFAATDLLMIPAHTIITKLDHKQRKFAEQRAAMITDALKVFGLIFKSRPNPIDSVLEYCDLPKPK